MSKLRERLQDASRSGVYRATAAQAIEEAVHGTGFNVGRISLAAAAGKQAMLEQIARALAFPDWFGGNWDALDESLRDLSWLDASGHVLVVEGGEVLWRRNPELAGTLVSVWTGAAAVWAAKGIPFHLCFVR